MPKVMRWWSIIFPADFAIIAGRLEQWVFDSMIFAISMSSGSVVKVFIRGLSGLSLGTIRRQWMISMTTLPWRKEGRFSRIFSGKKWQIFGRRLL